MSVIADTPARAGWLRVAAGGLLALALTAAPAAAQDDDAGRVLARVNGVDITASDVEQVAQDLAQQLQRVPPDQHLSILVNVMIDVKLMARAAEAEGIDQDPEVSHRLSNLRDNQLRAEYLRVKAFEPITEDVIQAAFDEELAAFEPRTEYKARHILVATEDEAKGVVEELDGGADFATIATERSLDPGSGRRGGELDYFGAGDMVPSFEEAAKTLDVGAYTAEPVESRFGWHVILLEETRDQPAPTLAERGPAIRQTLVRQALASLSDDLRAAAEIEIIDAEGETVPLQ